MKVCRHVDPPFALQIEPTEGCSLACSFCGIQSIRDNGADAESGTHGKNSAPYRFMVVRTVTILSKQVNSLGWNPRWEFAMHGEPTMNKDLPLMFKAVKKHNKRAFIQLTSNGSGLLKSPVDTIRSYFEAGMSTLALDDYKHSGGWVAKIVEAVRQDDDLSSVLKFYPKDKDGNPHRRHTKRLITVINDISDNSEGNHQLTNQGGNSFQATRASIEQPCAKPFRELSVRWDGNVALCCDDWVGKYKIGNVHDVALEDIWYSEEFEAARRRLFLGDRNFGPCRGCDVKSKRVGLLPDKMGKHRDKILPPDDESHAVLKSALKGQVFTLKLDKSGCVIP
jgi:radical SAM protein with 4Fe4S-binding SPASM domain